MLVLVMVGDRRAGLDGAEPVDGAGLEEQGFDEGRLAGPSVADYSDVADLSGLLSRHAREIPPWKRGFVGTILARGNGLRLAAGGKQPVHAREPGCRFEAIEDLPRLGQQRRGVVRAAAPGQPFAVLEQDDGEVEEQLARTQLRRRGREAPVGGRVVAGE
jgi:hypothetical protein